MGMVAVAALVVGLTVGTLGEGRVAEVSEVRPGRAEASSSFRWAQAQPAPAFVPGLATMLERDKLLHMSISANLALGTVALSEAFGIPRKWSLLLGVATAMAAGFLKEAWDMRGNGTAEWADLGANALGTAAGISVSLMFKGP